MFSDMYKLNTEFHTELYTLLIGKYISGVSTYQDKLVIELNDKEVMIIESMEQSIINVTYQQLNVQEFKIRKKKN